jgi:uncharacterized protein (UPF0332 family)
MERAGLHQARLSLAEQLLELAEHSSETEMRTSLSRSYYALYQVACTKVKASAHKEIIEALYALESGLGEPYRRQYELRQRADYDPDFINRHYGSVAAFRLDFPGIMQNARRLYEDLLKLEQI